MGWVIKGINSDSLRVSQSINTWIKEFLSQTPEQAMAETNKKNHRRALPLTRRTLEGCWSTWPAWWGVKKLSICCKSARKRIGGGEGIRFESYITCYAAHLNCYVMCYIDFPNCYKTCHITCYITHSICYIHHFCYITFDLFLYDMLYLLVYIIYNLYMTFLWLYNIIGYMLYNMLYMLHCFVTS